MQPFNYIHTFYLLASYRAMYLRLVMYLCKDMHFLCKFKLMKWLFLFCRNRKEEGGDGVDIESDTWSEDSGSENLSPSLSNNSSKSWDVVSEESTCDQDRSLSKKNRFGQPYLEYTEVSSPYQRVPFVEKVVTCSTLIQVVTKIDLHIVS